MSIRSFGNPRVRYNAVMSKTGVGAAAEYLIPITATGGSKATPGDWYVYHLFSPTDPGNLVITKGEAAMDVLIVGGGAGGGYDRGGGGGAGAFRPETFFAVVGTHPLSIGAGGAGDTSSPGADGGTPGGNTTFTYNSTPYVANGGGGGVGDGNTSGGLDSPGNGSGGGSTGSPVGASPWAGGDGGAYGNPRKGALGSTGTGGGGGGG